MKRVQISTLLLIGAFLISSQAYADPISSIGESVADTLPTENPNAPQSIQDITPSDSLNGADSFNSIYAGDDFDPNDAVLDSDGDGVPDYRDPYPYNGELTEEQNPPSEDPNSTTEDADGDGIVNAEDPYPFNPTNDPTHAPGSEEPAVDPNISSIYGGDDFHPNAENPSANQDPLGMGSDPSVAEEADPIDIDSIFWATPPDPTTQEPNPTTEVPNPGDRDGDGIPDYEDYFPDGEDFLENSIFGATQPGSTAEEPDPNITAIQP